MVNLLLFKDITKLIHEFININNNYKINKFIDYTKKYKNNYNKIYDSEFYSIYYINNLHINVKIYKNYIYSDINNILTIL